MPTQHGAAMTAGIDEGVELAAAVARDKDRLAPHVGREVVIPVRDLTFMREVDPVALEDVLHLEFEDLRIREDVASDPEDATCRVVFERGVDCLLDGIEHNSLPCCRSSLRVPQGITGERTKPLFSARGQH